MFDLFKKRQITVNDKTTIQKTDIDKRYGSSFADTLELCKQFKTDLVEMSEHNCTCGECAKYQGRVFSLTGKDKRYPKLPEFIFTTGQVHEGCKHIFSPYIHGVSIPTYHKDIIAFSNRPFVDNRSKAEIEEYDRIIAEEAELKKDREDYECITKMLPDKAPKSFGGYRKMKNANTKNFKELVIAAQEVGIKI